MGSLFIMIFGLAIAGVLSIWEGFVLTKLWGWFIVPFFDLPPLSITIAIGISLITAFLTHQRMAKDPDVDKFEQVVDLVGYSIVHGLIMLLMGWTVTLFM